MMAAPVSANGSRYLNVPRGLAIALAFAIAATLFFIIGYATDYWVEFDFGLADFNGGLFRTCSQSSCARIDFDCFDSDFEDQNIACGEHTGAVATGAIAIILLLISTLLLAQKLAMAARAQTAVSGFGPVVGTQCGAALFMIVSLVTGRLFYDKIGGSNADFAVGWSFNLVICSIVWLIASICCFAAYKRQVTVVVAGSAVQYQQTSSQSMYPQQQQYQYPPQQQQQQQQQQYPPQQQPYPPQQQPPAYAQPSPYGQAEKAPLLGQQ